MFYELTLKSEMPLTIVLTYLVYVKYMNYKVSMLPPFKRNMKSFLTFIMVIHNLIMTIYSIYSTINVVSIILNQFQQQSFIEFLSDREKNLKNNINKYIYIFYMSKYYELVDTIILHLNCKQASFLQTYHHAGAIISTFMLAKSQTHLGWIFVSLNSMVHTIMYLYYAFTCVGIKFRYKYFITNLQIIQFISGLSILMIHLLFAEGVLSDGTDQYAHAFPAFFNVFYVVILIILFKGFSKRTYGNKQKRE
ncbi:Elongation of fatty acids protein sre1 [Dictyocoela muelleri]|nr:Elongation of fatty acids protein sre1 [Dictyocoela muelleri]